MTDQNENETQASSVGDELRALGENLVAALREAWGSPERQKLQDEIETGLVDLGSSLKQAVTDFETSPTGQKMKADVEDLGERVRSGEVEGKIRSELLQALQTVNNELEKIAARMEGKKPDHPENSEL
jgi:hypothetical protein